jgi:hypothetical protein
LGEQFPVLGLLGVKGVGQQLARRNLVKDQVRADQEHEPGSGIGQSRDQPRQ